MANTLLLKRSAVAGKIPVAADLQVGELAVNLADAMLYTKRADNTVIPVGSIAPGSHTYVRTTFTATAGQTTFTVSYNPALLEVYVNGVLLARTDYTASNGSSIVLASAAELDDVVEVVAFTVYNINTVLSTNIIGNIPVTNFNSGTNASGTTFLRGDGTWQTVIVPGSNTNITSLSGITGGISSPDFVQFDTTATETNAVGKVYWDAGQGTLDLGLLGGNVVSRLGQSLVAYVTNAEAVTITKGQPVYLHQAQGDRATVKLASNLGDATSAKTLGLAAENIAAGQTGYVMCQGVLEGLNLGSFIAGDTLYVGATAGTLTATKPYAPNHLVYIGVVERANNGNGQIYVRPQNGYEMDELHNVSAQSPTNGDLLVYNSSTSLWTKSAQSTLVAGNVSGTVALANGGTGQTTANAAFNALAPSQTGNTGKILSTNGTDTSWVVMTDPTDIAISMAIALG